MTITIHGHLISTCTKRVAVVATELGIPFEVVNVDVPGGAHKLPAHTAIQPFGQIPYLVGLQNILFSRRLSVF
jgi:glutathione S-transferase